ncbi:MAG: arginine repressor [Syntrophomonadaceae bacterium]|nr:arginine repressor [Syntrophomonadaceae bacterium]MDD3023266.1 arginine repressor [Syntrophomonadaceae bacterium]
MKLRRHFAIMDILSKQRIATQEELCEALSSNGYDITQATVSRDIKEMHLIKIPDKEGYHYALPESKTAGGTYERMRRIFQDSVVSIDYSESLVVIKTLPGAAQSVASLIDASNHKNILGTVAGDDTVFTVVKPKEAVISVIEEFEQLVNA